jgi:HPt (histidine-containing phosphotransfer) domain-containing protein
MRQLNASLNQFVRNKHPEEAKKYRGEFLLESPETAVQASEESLQLKRIFCDEAERAIKTMKDTLTSGDVKLFTTTVHGMKSALANIGEYKASALAGVLEDYGNKGNIGYITANIASFIDTLKTLIKNNAPLEEPVVDDDAIDEDKHFLKAQLEIIKNACEGYDIQTAYRALNQLKEKQWKSETLATLQKINDHLTLDSDFDEAALKTEALLNEVNV